MANCLAPRAFQCTCILSVCMSLVSNYWSVKSPETSSVLSEPTLRFPSHSWHQWLTIFSPLWQLLVTQEAAGALSISSSVGTVCVWTRVGFAMALMTVGIALMSSSVYAVRNILFIVYGKVLWKVFLCILQVVCFWSFLLAEVGLNSDLCVFEQWTSRVRCRPGSAVQTAIVSTPACFATRRTTVETAVTRRKNSVWLTYTTIYTVHHGYFE